MAVTLSEIARALRGEISGRQVLAPGPNHSADDRSLSIKLSSSSPDGFVVHSHAGDDWRNCRDHVANALGLPTDRWRENREPDPAEVARRREAQRQAEERHQADLRRKQRQALAMWDGATHPRGTIVEAYLRSRALILPDEIAGEVLRFHPRCPWGDSTAPAMVAPFRCIRTGRILGVHRTALTAEGCKVGRKMFGTAAGCAIMLDGEDVITTGLAVGEGIESSLSARQLGISPVWALGSTSNIAAFPVLAGVQSLTLLEERDGGASNRACTECGTRWHRAGRAVDVVLPRIGKDLNDQIQEGATAWH